MRNPRFDGNPERPSSSPHPRRIASAVTQARLGVLRFPSSLFPTTSVKEVNPLAKTQELLYAVIGAGDLTVEKVRGLRELTDRKQTEKVYKDFVKRGRTISTRIKNSAPTKNAVAQTKTARSQVKAAATSVRKAVKADVRATTSAATKAAKAS